MGERRQLRGLLAYGALCVLIGISLVSWILWEPIGPVKDTQFTDLLKAGIDLRIEQSRAEFHLTLVAIGGLWGLVIAKKDEATILLSDVPELVMFCCANLLLLMSAVFHFLYVGSVSYVYWIAGTIDKGGSIPDVWNSGINSPFQFQLLCLTAGIVVSGITLLSAHKLK